MKGMGWAFVASVLGASVASAAPAPWFEIKSQHFTVISNSGEKEARRTAWQFEQVRQALQIVWPWAVVDGGRPITVFAVRDENTLKTLGPQYWEGKRYRPTSFWVGDSERTYIALRTDLAEPSDAGENPYQTAYWSYVSAVFHRSLPGTVPEWYGRGVSEVLSNTLVRDKELHVGRLMNNHLARVRDGALIPLDEFLAADRRSKYLTQESESWQFESQAWAFVHYLMFGEKGAHNGKVNRFNSLLAEGTDADVALKEAFGPTMEPYYVGVREYTRRDLFLYGRVPVSLGVKMEGFTSRSLSPAEGAQQRGLLLVAMNRPVEARAEASAAATETPSSPVPSEIEGALLDREGKRPEAQAAYEKAVALSSNRARVYYRLAQMIRPAGEVDRATNERIATLLGKAVELEPASANTLSYLADVRTSLGKPEDAVDLATRAVKLEPRETYHREALARALWGAKRPADAVAIARSARAVAEDDAQRASAQRLIDFLVASSPKTPPAPAEAPARPSPALSPAASPSADEDASRFDTFRTLASEPSQVQRALMACVNQDVAEACGRSIPVLDRMCRENDGYACRQLGSFHDRGHGVPMNKTKAAEAYDLGCTKAGDQESCARFAVLQAQGLGGLAKDAPTALATLERLCNSKVDDACLGWGLLLTTDIGWRDIPKARLLFKASCDGGNQEGCRLLQTVTPR